MPQVSKKYNYNKLCRQTSGFVKKPSVRQKIKEARDRHKAIATEVANYDENITFVHEDGTTTEVVVKASEKRYGIFNKKGYRAIKLFYTREEAERTLKSWQRPDFYEVREIEWFEEDKEND